MAQLGARLDGIEEVEGSNPFGSTKSNPAIGPSFSANFYLRLIPIPPETAPAFALLKWSIFVAEGR